MSEPHFTPKPIETRDERGKLIASTDPRCGGPLLGIEELTEQRIREGHIRFADEPDTGAVQRFIEHLERSAGSEGVHIDADECAAFACDLRAATAFSIDPKVIERLSSAELGYHRQTQVNFDDLRAVLAVFTRREVSMTAIAMARDSAETACPAPVPKDCQARCEAIAQEQPLECKGLITMQPYGMSDEEMEAAGISLGSAQPGQEQRMVTDAMIEAGERCYADWGGGHPPVGKVATIYTAMQAARPTADLGDDGELVERLRDEATALERAAWSRPDGGQDACIAANLANEAADRLILYREALESAYREGFQHARECLSDDVAFTLTEDVEEDCWRDSKARAVLSRSGG